MLRRPVGPAFAPPGAGLDFTNSLAIGLQDLWTGSAGAGSVLPNGVDRRPAAPLGTQTAWSQNGFTFDGTTNAMISIPSYSVTSSFTLEALVLTTSVAAGIRAVMRVGNLGLYLNQGKWGLFNNAFMDSVTVPVANRFYHLVATVSSASQWLYVNGRPEASGAGGSSTFSGTLTLGGDAFSQYLGGTLQKLAVYSRALTAAEAAAAAADPFSLFLPPRVSRGVSLGTLSLKAGGVRVVAPGLAPPPY